MNGQRHPFMTARETADFETPPRKLAPPKAERAFAPTTVTPAQRGDRVDLGFGLMIGFTLVGSGALMLADGNALGALVVGMGLSLVVGTTVQRLRR